MGFVVSTLINDALQFPPAVVLCLNPLLKNGDPTLAYSGPVLLSNCFNSTDKLRPLTPCEKSLSSRAYSFRDLWISKIAFRNEICRISLRLRPLFRTKISQVQSSESFKPNLLATALFPPFFLAVSDHVEAPCDKGTSPQRLACLQ